MNVNKALNNIMANNKPQYRKKKNNKKKNKIKNFKKAPKVKPRINMMREPDYRPLRQENGFRGLKTRTARGIGLAMKRMHEQAEAEYAASIVEPEIPLRTGALIKQPSLVPIPSTTTTFKNSFVLRTDANGSFFINWVPNYLHTALSLSSFKTQVNNNPFNCYTHINILGEAIGQTPGQLFGLKCYIPNIALSKYRLVSAKIRITYIGPAMNNAGYMCGSISYDPAVVGAGHGAGTADYLDYKNADASLTTRGVHDSIFDIVYRNFAENKILNGLWPKSLSMKGNGSGMSAVFIPTDPTDETFYKLGLFYGDTVKYNVGSSGFMPITSADGAHSNYYFNGHGWYPNEECIRIETIYNFEIVPTAESAPLLRITDEQPKGVSIPKVRDMVRRAINAGEGLKPKAVEDIELVIDDFPKVYGRNYRPLWNARNYWKAVTRPLLGAIGGKFGFK